MVAIGSADFRVFRLSTFNFQLRRGGRGVSGFGPVASLVVSISVVVSLAAGEEPASGLAAHNPATLAGDDKAGVAENRVAKLQGVIGAVGKHNAATRSSGEIGR